MVLDDWDNVREGAIEMVVLYFIGTYINQFETVQFKKSQSGVQIWFTLHYLTMTMLYYDLLK